MFGAASTFARHSKVTDAEALEFLHLLDADGDGAATLQEITDKANELDAELGSLAGLPSLLLFDVSFLSGTGLD